MDATTPTRRVKRSSVPAAIHGDCDINGDLVDELHHGIRLIERERRLAAAISGVHEGLERSQLENVMRALDRVPA